MGSSTGIDLFCKPNSSPAQAPPKRSATSGAKFSPLLIRNSPKFSHRPIPPPTYASRCHDHPVITTTKSAHSPRKCGWNIVNSFLYSANKNAHSVNATLLLLLSCKVKCLITRRSLFKLLLKEHGT